MPDDLKVLEEFMQRAQNAVRTGSKELRIPMPEGHELVAAISKVLAINVNLSNQLRENEKLIGSKIRINGGKF